MTIKLLESIAEDLYTSAIVQRGMKSTTIFKPSMVAYYDQWETNYGPLMTELMKGFFFNGSGQQLLQRDYSVVTGLLALEIERLERVSLFSAKDCFNVTQRTVGLAKLKWSAQIKANTSLTMP